MEFVNAIYKLFVFDNTHRISLVSGNFFFLFIFFLFIFSIIHQNRVIRTFYVIAFSLFFYYKLTGWNFLVLLIPVVVDYYAAIEIHRHKNTYKKNLWLAASICSSIGLLIYFKYTNFFASLFCDLIDKGFTVLKIIAPVGISYYIFRTISYIIDVYRKDMPPTRDFPDFMFYMTYFPLLIQGPITRASTFLPQLNKRPEISQSVISRGLFLIISGLIKKAVIADYLGQYCNIVFDAPGSYSGFENLMAIYGFAVQVYFDFSGYTDIAIGFSAIIGFDIGINFNKPYHALNVADFWRRWHISLSSWLRDYLFKPLSLKFRGIGKMGIYLALFITFVICGLWHGAEITFIIWGLLHAFAMMWDALTSKLRKKIKKKTFSKTYRFISWFITMNFIIFTWIFFRAKDLDTAIIMFRQVFGNMDLAYVVPFLTVRLFFVLIILLGIMMYAVPVSIYSKMFQRFSNMPIWLKAIILIVVLQLIVQFQGIDVMPFLYEKF